MEGATHSFDRYIKANTAGGTTGYTPKKSCSRWTNVLRCDRTPTIDPCNFPHEYCTIIRRQWRELRQATLRHERHTYVTKEVHVIDEAKISACKVWKSLTAETVRLVQKLGKCLVLRQERKVSQDLILHDHLVLYIPLRTEVTLSSSRSPPPPPPPYNPLNIIWICHDGSPYNLLHERARFKYHGRSWGRGWGGEWCVLSIPQSSKSGKINTLIKKFKFHVLKNFKLLKPNKRKFK
jgi:hypothetical protein